MASIGNIADACLLSSVTLCTTKFKVVVRAPYERDLTSIRLLNDIYDEVHELLEDYGYTIHIRLRREHRVNCKRMPRYRARHWIVERTHSWMNRGNVDYIPSCYVLVASILPPLQSPKSKTKPNSYLPSRQLCQSTHIEAGLVSE